MSFLAVTEAKLPPGFRFHPRDDELVCDYLARKISKHESNEVPAMVEVDLNKCEPWDLPDSAKVGEEWYFFSQKDRKYSTGLRTNRATISGYWKATGKDRQIHDVRTGQRVGARKTLVFYNGRAPKGRKSDWVMHEFRIQSSPASLTELPPFEEDWVLCRVFHKNRGSSTKSSTGGDSYDERISSLLPALVDHPFHVSSINPEGYEHGPCFSNLLQNHTPHFEEKTEVGVRFDNLWPDYEEGFISDSRVFKSVVLDHLMSRAEEGGIKSELSPTIGGESFTGSVHSTYSHGNYLSDTELSHMWNNFEPQ